LLRSDIFRPSGFGYPGITHAGDERGFGRGLRSQFWRHEPIPFEFPAALMALIVPWPADNRLRRWLSIESRSIAGANRA
jgi:hypothetical protein